jgi:hypothetical protein
LPPEEQDTWLDRPENLKPFAGERIFTLKHHAEVEGDDKGNQSSLTSSCAVQKWDRLRRLAVTKRPAVMPPSRKREPHNRRQMSS